MKVEDIKGQDVTNPCPYCEWQEGPCPDCSDTGILIGIDETFYSPNEVERCIECKELFPICDLAKWDDVEWCNTCLKKEIGLKEDYENK